MAKYCMNCGKELAEDAKCCPNCQVTIPDAVYSNKPTAVISNPKTTNGFSIAGLVLGLISILCCGSTSILGLVFSIIGLSSANKNNDNSRGVSIAGIVISCLGLLVLLFFVVFTVLSVSEYNFTGNDIINERVPYNFY